jgi:membrane protease YdiL (CAAX protease family)
MTTHSPEPPTGAGRLPALSTRPWWARVVAVLLLACVVWPLVNAIAVVTFGPEYSLASHGVRAALTTVLVVGALALLLRWENTRPFDYGLVIGADAFRGFAIGAVGYLIPCLIAVVVLIALHLVTFDVSASPLVVIGQGLTVFALVVLYEAVPEEFIFRGYLFRVLAERMPGWATIVTQAVLFCAFGAIVGAAQTFDRLLLFFAFSLSLGYVRQITGTVFASMGFHAVFQTIAQWSANERWDALNVNDPAGWFALVALGIAPFALAPVVCGVLTRRADKPTATSGG